MKSGYYIYNNEKYRFELEDEYITVVNENGVDWKKLANNFNEKYEKTYNIQVLKVKLFPNWNDAIIFHNHNLDSICLVSTFRIFGIIEFKHNEKRIDALNIYAKELDYIYDSRRVLSDLRYDKKGNMDILIKPFDEVNSEKKQIKLKNIIFDYSFEIKREISTKDINNYFTANAMLKCEWNSLLDDYELIYNIIMSCYTFISYLYYRQNINLNSIELLSRDKEGRYLGIGQMSIYVNDIVEPEEDYVKKYYIDYNFIKNIDDRILQAIIDQKIFTRHIPENEIKRNKITPQSFVIISSAFEWEFSQLFPEGVKHREGKTNKIEEIKKDLVQLSSNYNKGKKKIIDKILENAGKDNLESKLIYTNEKLKNTSEIFLQYLCNLNNIENKNKIFTNLQRLRNDFAHGNMNIDIDSDGFVGIIYLERLVYIMQLKRFGLDDKNIKMSINKLFGSNLAL